MSPPLSCLVAVVLVMGGVLAGSAAAQVAPASPPGEVSAAALDAVFARYASTDAPGCAVGVARDGQQVFARGYGRASLEHDLPITPRTVFNIGSISKQFTAFAALLLAERGRLLLEDDVRRFVPELPERAPPIRVRDLLQHTSGLRDYGTLGRLAAWPVNTTADFLDLLARQRGLNFPTGSRHAYSHSDYELLGVLVERAAGEPLAELLRREVWTPLGMTSTRVQDSRMAPIPGRAFAYREAAGGWHVRFPDSEMVGGSNVWSSVEDLLRWMRNFETAEVGGRELVDRLTSRPSLASGETIPYAWGLMLGEHRGLRTVYRRGGAGGFLTEMVRYPDQGLSIVTLCNVSPSRPRDLNRAVAQLFLGDEMRAEPEAAASLAAPAPQDELERLTGWYRWPAEPWNVLRIEEQDGVLCDVGEEVYRLERVGEARYRDDDLLYDFSQSHDGRAQRLVVTWEGGGEDFERRPGDALWAPTSAELSEYSGRFASEDLGLVWELSIVDGALELRRPRAGRARTMPVDRDLFRAPLEGGEEPLAAGLRFARDATGRITGFGVTAVPDPYEVVCDLRFERID